MKFIAFAYILYKSLEYLLEKYNALNLPAKLLSEVVEYNSKLKN